MTVQEIFNTTTVRSIEEHILSLYHETERNHWYNEENKKAIKSFLEVRKQILDSMFVMDELEIVELDGNKTENKINNKPPKISILDTYGENLSRKDYFAIIFFR